MQTSAGKPVGRLRRPAHIADAAASSTTKAQRQGWTASGYQLIWGIEGACRERTLKEAAANPQPLTPIPYQWMPRSAGGGGWATGSAT